jgi:hypothetical protein
LALLRVRNYSIYVLDSLLAHTDADQILCLLPQVESLLGVFLEVMATNRFAAIT